MADQLQLHVVMFPWVAQGHITPFLELAKDLVTHGLRISFVSAPLNVAKIKKQRLAGIELVDIPLPSVEGLPAGIESTAALSEIGREDLMPLLFHAVDLWEQPFEELLKLLSPDFFINDALLCRNSGVVERIRVPTITMIVASTASMSFRIGQFKSGLPEIAMADDLILPPPGFPSSVVRERLFEAHHARLFYENKLNGLTIMDRISISVDGSWATIGNTCLELEAKFVEYCQRRSGKLAFPVGIFMSSLPPLPAADPCLVWLDKQQPRSVVFVSFRSECVLTAQQLTALLLSLDESGVAFLCVLRRTPLDFENFSVTGRGLVVTEWATQLHILKHPSTGAFLSHCRWNSVTEGVRFGLPFVALPMQYEQGLSARLIVEELKLGVEVRINEEDGSFTEDIATAIRRVMVDEEGNGIRANAEEMSRVLTVEL